MKLSHVLGCTGIALALTGCFKKEKPPVAPPATEAAPVAKTNANVVAPMPDAGKLGTTATTATGIGPNAAAAVDEAIKMAIKQVNGVSVDMSSDTLRSVLAVTVGKSGAEMQAKAFSDYVSQQSGGVVTNFKVIKIDEPMLGKGSFKATIEANIAKFDAPSDSKKLKIVIGPVRVNADSFKLAGIAVPSGQVANEVRQKILNALTNTGRFSVLDRELGDDVQQEMDMISSGQAPSAERSKMSQAISADLIWTGGIDAFSYQGADGSWSINQRVINVSTRQVQLSNILQGNLGAAGSAYKTNADKAKDALETQMVGNVVSAILVRTFPITVASRDAITLCSAKAASPCAKVHVTNWYRWAKKSKIRKRANHWAAQSTSAAKWWSIKWAPQCRKAISKTSRCRLTKYQSVACSCANSVRASWSLQHLQMLLVAPKRKLALSAKLLR